MYVFIYEKTSLLIGIKLCAINTLIFESRKEIFSQRVVRKISYKVQTAGKRQMLQSDTNPVAKVNHQVVQNHVPILEWHYPFAHNLHGCPIQKFQ